MINDHADGGLKVPHIQSFCKSLKMSWLTKFLDPLNQSPWKILLLFDLEKYGGDKVLFLTKEGIQKVSTTLNPFWRDIFINYSNLLTLPSEDDEQWNEKEFILAQPLWLNNKIKIDGQMGLNKKYIKNDIFFVNDLMSDLDTFFSYAGFIQKHNFHTNFIEFYGLLNSIPVAWKRSVSGKEKLPVVENIYVNKLKNCIKPCKIFYKLFIEKIKESPINCQKKWSEELEFNLENLNDVFSSIYMTTKNTQLQNFQFKLIHRILQTNVFLYKCKRKETELCSFCFEVKEKFLHLFWECNIVKNFWLSISSKLKNFAVNLELNGKKVILGFDPDSDSDKTVHTIILILKYYIYVCKCKNIPPRTEGGIEFLKYYIRIEQQSADYMTPAQRGFINRKWESLSVFLSG